MTETILHRGPDGSGIWVDRDGRCALGHRRLSIIDTSDAGAQPFASHDNRWWVTFNGEIYNFQDIRAELERKSHIFRSRSDTEVLVQALAEWGPSAVEKFDGMFAFAAFDSHSGELILARDPFGEKPLFYTTLADGTFAFASELRSLEILPGFSRAISVDAVAEYLSFQYIGAPRSIYEGVSKLPPGHLLLKSKERTQAHRYYQFNPGRDLDRSRSMVELADELEDILTRSIERRLIADVPLGAFLSGGVDSSLVCALATQKLHVPLNTYSMGFHAAPESEHLIARQFAHHLGTIHHEEIVSPDVEGFLDIAGRVLDEPNADTSCLPTYLLSRFARGDVTVAISGDGGDEMFGGYGRYMRALLERDMHNIGEIPFWKPGTGYYGPSILIASEPQIKDLLGELPPKFLSHLSGLRDEINASSVQLLAALRRSDVDNYLHGAVLAKVDRMSMQHSLEVRTPFLNVELARFAEKLPESMCAGRSFSKRLLREVAYRYLPKHLVNLPKQGFGLPMADWARQSLLPKAQAMLTGDSVLRRSLGSEAIDLLLARQGSAGGFHAYQLWSVVILEAWLRERNVDFPIVAAEPPRSIAEPAAKRHSVLWAVPVAEKLFCVISGFSDEPAHLNLKDLDQNLYGKLLVLQSGREKASEDASPIQLPMGDKPRTPDLKGASAFRGATLLFLDRDASVWIGARACRDLRALEVRRIVTLHRAAAHLFEDLEFQYKDSAHEKRDLEYLWQHRIGAFTGNPLLQKFAGAWPLHRVGKKLFHVGPLPQIPFDPAAELTEQYAVFEGRHQCPPLRMGFDEVDAHGDGRYCVHRQVIGLSKSKTLAKRFPRWAVPINDMTSQYLPIRPLREGDRVPLAVASPGEPVQMDSDEEFFARFMKAMSDASSDAPLVSGDRIAVVTHALPPGGAERQWVYLAKALKKKGFQVTFVVQGSMQGDNAHYLPYLTGAGIEVLQACDLPFAVEAGNFVKQFPAGLGTFSEATKLAQLVNALRLISPRVVFAQLDSTNISAAMAGLICGVDRIVVSFRNYNPSNFDYIYNHWFLSAYRAIASSPKVVLTGNFSGANEDYANWIGLARNRVHTIPNALDRDLFTVPGAEQIRHVREELKLPEGTPVILGVFRFSDEKGPLDFTAATLKILKEHGDVHALVAGVGPLETEMRTLLNASALADRFHFLGRRDDISALMSVSTLLLHAGRKEGMPNVIMEAMLSGLPVVATDAGATRELVVDGETGFVHRIGDVDALAKSCRRILTDPALGSRMKEAVAFRVKDQFSPEKMAERYLEATGLCALPTCTARPLAQPGLAEQSA